MEQEIKTRKKKEKKQLSPITIRLTEEEKTEMKKDMKLFKTDNISAYVRTLISKRGEIKKNEIKHLDEELKNLDQNFKNIDFKLLKIQEKTLSTNELNEIKSFREEHKNNSQKIFNEIQAIKKLLKENL